MADLLLDYEMIHAARNALLRAHEALELRALGNLDMTPSDDLRLACRDASEYANGVLTVATMSLVGAYHDLNAIEVTFRDLDAEAKANVSSSRSRSLK